MAKDRAHDSRRVFQNPISHVKVMPSGSADATKRNAFGLTDATEKTRASDDAAEVAEMKKIRGSVYGGNPDGYYEIRSNEPTKYRA